MNNLLLSAAIGDIAGMPYEFKGRFKRLQYSRFVASDKYIYR